MAGARVVPLGRLLFGFWVPTILLIWQQPEKIPADFRDRDMKKTWLMASLVVTIGYLGGAVQAADTSSAEAVDVVAVSGEAADCVRDLIEPGLSPEATGLSPEAALIQCLSKYPFLNSRNPTALRQRRRNELHGRREAF